MSAFEEDMFDDLAYDEAEGAAALFDDDGFDALDEMEGEAALFDDADAWDTGDEFMDDAFDGLEGDDDFDAYAAEDAYAADDFDDDFDGYDDYDDYDDFEADEAEDLLDSAMAYALDAEDADEFFKKLWRGVKKVGRGVVKVARKAAPVIGKIARVAAPILSKIPHPYAQIAGKAAGLLSRLRAEGASEEEALEAFAELAAKDPRALPIVAGLTARTVLKRSGKRMSMPARKRAVKDAKTAAKILVRRRGPGAIRAMPKIAAAVRRNTAAKGTPPSARTKVVKRAAARVASSAKMTRKLSRPSPRARVLVGKIAMKTRTIIIPGPARLTISAL